MKRVALVVALTSVALAAPDKPRVTWADWVGSYRGTLTWSNCITPGAKSATLVLDAADAVMTIDLAPASAGLRAMSLVDEGDGWAAQQGDVKASVKRPKANRLDVVVELDSGCRMTGHLDRRSSVAACDALVAWSRIEARCTKLRAPALEDAAKLAAATWKPADAGQCSARAAKLELELVDAGCAPHPDPLIGVRARACLELTSASAKLSRCGTIPREVKDAIVLEAQALAAAAQTADKATLPYVEQQCRDAKASIGAVATRFSCSL